MTSRVVIAYANLGDTAIESAILRDGGAEVVVVPGLEDAEYQVVLNEADALMVTLQPVPAATIEVLTKCRIICRVGTGVDAIDIPAATASGIWVTNVPDYAVDEVSSHALALLLALARNLVAHRDAVRAGTWRYLQAPPIGRLSGKTLGILGLGRIGRATARKARGLGLDVIAHDPYVPDDEFVAVGAKRVDFGELLAGADFLSLHIPLTAETRHLIDRSTLSRMKHGAYLINTARGEVVDIDALLEAVQGEHLAGAAIDVLPVEPPAVDEPLLREDRIIVTPHVAWASTEAARDVRVRGAEDVVRVLRGERPRYPLNEVLLTKSGVA